MPNKQPQHDEPQHDEAQQEASKERDALIEELKTKASGFEMQQLSDLSAGEIRILRETALRILRGDINLEEISNLEGKVGKKLVDAFQYIFNTENTAAVRNLEEVNPYYSRSNPNIIKD